MSPHGHTISVSDIWAVAHYYGLLSTTLGEIQSVGGSRARATSGDAVICDVIVKCTGYWKNERVRTILGTNFVFSNNVIRLNLVYQAEAVLDDAGGFQSPGGSSYLEGVAFSLLMLMGPFKSDGCFSGVGATMDIVDATASKSLEALYSTMGENTEFASESTSRILDRSLNYHHRFLPA